MLRFSLFFLLLAYSLFSKSQITSKEIVEKSLNYHDPNNNWSELKALLIFEEKRPDGEIRNTTFELNNATGNFRLNRGNQEIHGMDLDSCYIEKGDVNCERVQLLRNYYLYLWGLPMKLQDNGTAIDKNVSLEKYEGKPAFVVRVPYEKDTWYFYFDQSDYRMIGYKFFQDSDETKGEWIQLEGEIVVNGIKIPQTRRWYTIPEMEFLGEDKLVGSK